MIAPTSFFADYGCHVRILEEALSLQSLGNEVTICTYHNGQDVVGLAIERSLYIPWRKEYEVGSSRHKIALDVLLFAKSLSASLRRRPDIVHAHLHEGALIGYFLNRLQRMPLIFDFQGGLTSEMMDHAFLSADSPLYRPLRWLEEVIDRSPHFLMTSTGHAAELLVKEFNCRPEKIRVVPDAVNPNAFHPDVLREGECEALRAGLGIPPDRRVVVYLGLLAEYQGTSLLLQAAARLRRTWPEVHFLIMGYPAVEYYRDMAQRLGVSDAVTFTGKMSYFQAPRYLVLGEVAVAPKISNTEGNGKLLNYMAMGLPVVAFDAPVNRELLGGSAFYARYGDAESLAEELVRALENSARARQMGRELRRLAIERYSTEDMGRRIMDVYREALAGQSPPGDR
jgi:glycosyltransferase involved in cell wall biosynthesis